VAGATLSTAPVAAADGTQTAIRYHIDTPPVVIAAFHLYGYSGAWTQPLEALERAAFGQKIDGAIREKLGNEVRATYGRLGFIDMKMTDPVWGRPMIVNGEVAVPVTASITSEGGQYHVSGMHLNGDVFMTQEQFVRSARLHAGDVANEDVWQQVKEMVAAPYRSHGYLTAKIDAAPTLDRAQHTVAYTITVEPGPVYHMGQLTLVNLDAKQKAELMPYWQLHNGDAFNPELIPKSISDYHRERAPDLQSIRTRFTAKWTADSQMHTVDVVLTFDTAKN
jgi:outer membrane protein assembly factor BamA